MLLVVAGLPVLVATAAVLLRAVRRREDRAAWIALGLALAAQTVGTRDARGARRRLALPDARRRGLVTFFPLTFAAALLFARARLRRFGLALWLDAAVGTLGAAAIVTQLLGTEVDRVTGGGWASAVALAYPMGDVLLVVLVVVAITLRGAAERGLAAARRRAAGARGRRHRLRRGRARRRAAPLWVPLFGLASPVLIAIAAWVRAPRPRQVALEGWRMLVTPSLLALVAGGLLVLDHFRETTDAAVWLSGATLVAVLGRMALTYHENTALHASRELALTDELTGLANRRLFHERLKEELATVDGEAALAIAMVDLDRFKELNDTLGHHAGDRLLAQLGPRLNDVVGDAGLVARLGGDEFALLLPGAGLAAASELARRLGVMLQTPFEIDGLEVVMDASVGVALCPDNGVDADSLLQRADVAMYQAKEARTGFQAYDPTRDRHSRERLALMAELRRALERDELILHYQPKVDLQTGLVAGVEALVRWQHPVHGLRGPGAFLPHAEHTGADAAADAARARDRALPARAVADRRARPARRRQPRGTEPARPTHPGACGGASGAPRAAAGGAHARGHRVADAARPAARGRGPGRPQGARRRPRARRLRHRLLLARAPQAAARQRAQDRQVRS